MEKGMSVQDPAACQQTSSYLEEGQLQSQQQSDQISHRETPFTGDD